jgi:hypothetical protein
VRGPWNRLRSMGTAGTRCPARDNRRERAVLVRLEERSSRSWRVPNPPGMTSRSIGGALAKSKCGKTRNPPVACTVSANRATVNTLNGADASDRRDSTPGTRRVRENTSNGPAKSSTSTPSKMKIAVFNLFILHSCQQAAASPRASRSTRERLQLRRRMQDTMPATRRARQRSR